MSHWLLENLHKRHLLLLKVYGVCFFFHLMILAWVFFIYNHDSSSLSLTLRKSIDYSSPILFTPVPIQSASKEAPSIQTTHLAQKTPVKKAPVIEKTTTVAAAPQKKELPHKKEEVIKSFSEEKVVQKHPQKPENKPLIDKSTLAKNNSSPVNNTPTDAQLLSNYKEVEALRRTALLQKELSLRWQPPSGVPTDTRCEVSFWVNDKGKAHTINITQRSGIRMYDISARNALVAMKMPQWTYGKSITITFI